MAKEQARRDTQQAELLLGARVAVIDTKKAQLVAQKILAQHSTKMKVALSELVVQMAEDLRSPGRVNRLLFFKVLLAVLSYSVLFS